MKRELPKAVIRWEQHRKGRRSESGEIQPGSLHAKEGLRKPEHEATDWREHVDRLASYLAEFVIGKPCESKSAVDIAMRVIGELKSDLEYADAAIRGFRQASANTHAQVEINRLRSELDLLKAAINNLGAVSRNHGPDNILDMSDEERKRFGCS